MGLNMQTWTKQIELPANQPNLTLSQQMQQWQLPRRIRGQLRQEKRVLLNGHYQPVSTVLHPADKIRFYFIESDFRTSESSYIYDWGRKIDVLYENADFLVVNKPAGIKTHPNSPGEGGTLLNFVQGYLASIPDQAAYMVHRLDEGTSGAIIVAKTPYAVPLLNTQLKAKQIRRTYLAWVQGRMTQESGMVDLPIGYHPSNNRLRKINGLAAKEAVTHWRLLASNGTASLLQVQLETGRTHQIRVHLAELGHPLLGDQDYNPLRESNRLQLHSYTTSLVVPFSQKEITLVAPLPADFKRPPKGIEPVDLLKS